MKVYNTSVHEGMEYTSHELVFERSARVTTNSTLPDDKSNELYSEYTLFKRLFAIQASSRQNLEHTKIRSNRYYDGKANPQVLYKDVNIQRRLRIFVKGTIER